MTSISVHLSSVHTLGTGSDGGHIYIKGRGEIPGEGECDIYAYFASREQEREFAHLFKGQAVVIEGRGIEFTRGVGGAIREVVSWRFA